MRVMKSDLIGAHERRCCHIHGCIFVKDIFDDDRHLDECRVWTGVTKQAHDDCDMCLNDAVESWRYYTYPDDD